MSDFPRKMLPATPPPAMRTAEEIAAEQRRAEEAKRIAEVAHLHELCRKYANNYDQAKLDLERAKVRHYDELERQRTRCIKAMLKKFAMWAVITIAAFAGAVMLLAQGDIWVQTAGLREYSKKILYRQSGEISGTADETLCPTVYVKALVPVEDCDQHSNQTWHLRRYKKYTLDVYVFYSDLEQFGRSITIKTPKVVEHNSLETLSINYAFDDDEQTLFWHFIGAADEEVRIDDDSFERYERATIVNSKDRVKSYIAKEWAAGSYDPEELLPNLYHFRVTFKTGKPSKTYTYTSSFSAIGWDFLVLFIYSFVMACCLVPCTIGIIQCCAKKFFRKKSAKRTAAAEDNAGDSGASDEVGVDDVVQADSDVGDGNEAGTDSTAGADNSTPPPGR